jgi:hypothetical protein
VLLVRTSADIDRAAHLVASRLQIREPA